MVNFEELLKVPGMKNTWGPRQHGPFNICTDSRSLDQRAEGDLKAKRNIFIALDGPNFRGMDFVPSVVNGPCQVVIFNMLSPEGQDNVAEMRPLMKDNPQTTFIGVKDTLLFIQELGKTRARLWLEQNPGRRIIGITGSNGKTTNKEMLFTFLHAARPTKVLCTEKNFNNHLGVPKTLLDLDDSKELAIVEMGTNHPGEIPLLTNLALPNSGIITNIGQAHMEFFNTEENIFQEKGQLYFAVKNNGQGKGLFMVNGNDPFLRKLPASEGLYWVVDEDGADKLGLDKGHTVLMKWNGGTQVEVLLQNKKFILSNEYLTGKHNFRNLATTFALAWLMFPEEEKALVDAAATFRPMINRSSWIKVGEKNFFLDAYNANPSSMKESLQGFMDRLRQQHVDINGQFYILGDMNELGPHARKLHIEVAGLLKKLGGKNIAFIGKYSSYYKEGFQDNCIVLESLKTFQDDYWPQIREKYQYFFIKGSRSLKLETLLEKEGI